MHIYEIKNDFQLISLLDHGATIYEWSAYSDKTSIMLNNHKLEDYLDSGKGYFGSTVGRVANRTKNATFNIGNKTYELHKNDFNKNNLHSGPEGFNVKKFDVVDHTETKIVFKYISPDMEMGFPGEVTLYVTYELNGNNLKLSYNATTTKDTILNITNHGYFNLGDKDVLNHQLFINANHILEVDKELIPTGKFLNSKQTPLDFTKERVIGESIKLLNRQNVRGLDHAFIFNGESNPQVVLKYKNKKLSIDTSYPAVQVYSCNHKFKQLTKDLKEIPIYGAIAIECQIEPDAINNPNFNNVILKKGQAYHHYISYTLTEENNSK